MPMATSPLPWFAHQRGIYQMPSQEELSKQGEKMPVTTVLQYPPPTVSPPTLAYPSLRFLRMETETSGHHSPLPRVLTPVEHREGSATTRSPHTAEEEATPLDFSRPTSNVGVAAKEAPRSPSYGGVVDLCTRISPKESPVNRAEGDEERRNTSRGSSSEGENSYNVSSEGILPSGNGIQHPQHHPHPVVTSPTAVVQQYPLHPVALHPHHHQHFIMAAAATTPQQSSPQMGMPEGTAVNPSSGGSQGPNFQGILSLTPPPPLPLHVPMTATVPHPLSPHQQPPFPPMLPAPLHQTLAAATSCKSDSGTKMTRPFKAYPKDPLTLTVGVSTAESLLGQASNEAYVEFRKQMLRQVAAAKARRPVQSQQGSEDQNSSGESAESAQQQLQQQQSSSSGDEESTPGASKKRTRNNSESNSPYSVVKDAAYWERRRKNNEAAKRSRDARRAKEDEIAIRAAFLEQENLKLKYEVAALRHETSNLRCLLYSAANSS